MIFEHQVYNALMKIQIKPMQLRHFHTSRGLVLYFYVVLIQKACNAR
jgi:hypothetical protein